MALCRHESAWTETAKKIDGSPSCVLFASYLFFAFFLVFMMPAAGTFDLCKNCWSSGAVSSLLPDFWKADYCLVWRPCYRQVWVKNVINSMLSCKLSPYVDIQYTLTIHTCGCVMYWPKRPNKVVAVTWLILYIFYIFFIFSLLSSKPYINRTYTVYAYVALTSRFI